MKRKSAAPRSFLRQLAEPIPRTAAPLIPRRPAVERGAASRSTLNAIPQIIDVTEIRDAGAPEPQQAQPAASNSNRPPQRRTRASARPDSSLVNTTTSTAALHAQTAKQSSPNQTETILQSSMREDTSNQAETPSAAAQLNAPLQSVLAHSFSAQATSLLSPAPPQTTAKAGKRPDISVHIGTIEVRVPAPPTRAPQPAAAALNPRNTRNAVPSGASEPLSRSLAWSHGLVQG
jgi:hypothetical protein